MKLSRWVGLLISLMLDLLPGVTPAATACEFTQGQAVV
jgi:hypothetical protein